MHLSFLAALILGLVVLLSEHGAHAQFENDWDKPFLFECPQGQVLQKIYSVHDNKKEDRRWKFGCADGPAGCVPKDCRWTGYVNNWDRPMNFLCPTNYVISGLQSYHDNGKEDRLFKFKCCRQEDYVTYACSLTRYINDWDGVLNYNVPNDQVIAGMASVHDNHREDRRFQFFVCRYG